MEGWQGTFQSHGLTKFLQGQIGLLAQDGPHFLAMPFQNHRLAPGIAMPRADVSPALALLEKLFDHAQGNAETMSDLLTGAFLLVVGSQDSFAQVERQSLHVQTLSYPGENGYSFI